MLLVAVSHQLNTWTAPEHHHACSRTSVASSETEPASSDASASASSMFKTSVASSK
uniref:Uncharacterized protein n=1 Tax=Arundo donax TaxID=35708 RepID=A0A0A9FE37_ARUDO